MSKPNPFLQKIEKKHLEELMETATTCFQVSEDAALLAAHDVLHLGEGRAEEFIAAFKGYISELNNLIRADYKADKSIEYAMDKIDKAILNVVGQENFKAFPERYKRTIYERR